MVQDFDAHCEWVRTEDSFAIRYKLGGSFGCSLTEAVTVPVVVSLGLSITVKEPAIEFRVTAGQEKSLRWSAPQQTNQTQIGQIDSIAAADHKSRGEESGGVSGRDRPYLCNDDSLPHLHVEALDEWNQLTVPVAVSRIAMDVVHSTSEHLLHQTRFSPISKDGRAMFTPVPIRFPPSLFTTPRSTSK